MAAAMGRSLHHGCHRLSCRRPYYAHYAARQAAARPPCRPQRPLRRRRSFDRRAAHRGGTLHPFPPAVVYSCRAALVAACRCAASRLRVACRHAGRRSSQKKHASAPHRRRRHGRPAGGRNKAANGDGVGRGDLLCRYRPPRQSGREEEGRRQGDRPRLPHHHTAIAAERGSDCATQPPSGDAPGRPPRRYTTVPRPPPPCRRKAAPRLPRCCG